MVSASSASCLSLPCASHLDKMLGEDYIGTFDNTVFYLGDLPSQLQGYYMTIDR